MTKDYFTLLDFEGFIEEYKFGYVAGSEAAIAF